ncbi:unnamed protein product, partial [Rotaria magnacalcarata]
MCYYCHTLQYNPDAPVYRGFRCHDRSNLHSKVPMNQRIYDCGQSIIHIPPAPPANGIL